MTGEALWWTALGWSEAEYRRFCHTKRFLERWRADPQFRLRVPQSPQRTFQAYGLHADPEGVRPVWVEGDSRPWTADERVVEELPEPLRQYDAYLRWRSTTREQIRRDSAPSDLRWRRWYERQLARARTELGRSWCDQAALATAAFELSRGCSVGCWFCALSAQRATGHRAYDAVGARLFRSLLEAVGELTGPRSLALAGLYWATDPFDNPDFEGFAGDFQDASGAPPRITTALALRDVRRTRAWLDRPGCQEPRVTRFSILSLGQLDALHRSFEAEALGHVDCVLLNRESLLPKANAGRFRERARRDARLLESEARKLPQIEDAAGPRPEALGGTIACVAGFLFNLVDGSLKLIAPCRATDRWPSGYRVLGEGAFRDVAEARGLLRRLVEDHMSAELPRGAHIRFREDLQYRLTADGFEAWTTHGGMHFGHAQRAVCYREIGDLIAAGRHTADAIAARLWSSCQILPAETFRALNAVHGAGLLMEGPCGSQEHARPVPGGETRWSPILNR